MKIDWDKPVETVNGIRLEHALLGGQRHVAFAPGHKIVGPVWTTDDTGRQPAGWSNEYRVRNVPAVETPQFKHDCDCCTFLGRHTRYGSRFDLYHCTKQTSGPTLIVRWSDDGPDYSSGLQLGWQNDDRTIPIVEARFRAEAAGLDVQREKYRPKPRPYDLATWPAEATRLRGPLWTRGEWSLIQYAGPDGVAIRIGVGRGSISLVTWQVLADTFEWSADGREWHPCVRSF